MEIARINDSVVAGRKTLASLGERLAEETRKALKLPVIFFFCMDVRDFCYLTDETAVQALQAPGDPGEGRRLTNGRLWVARAIAYAIAQKYPTAIQFAMV